MMERLRRAIRAGIIDWRDPRGLRKAMLTITADGHLVALEFPDGMTVRERNNVRRELADALVAGGYWKIPAKTEWEGIEHTRRRPFESAEPPQ